MSSAWELCCHLLPIRDCCGRAFEKLIRLPIPGSQEFNAALNSRRAIVRATCESPDKHENFPPALLGNLREELRFGGGDVRCIPYRGITSGANATRSPAWEIPGKFEGTFVLPEEEDVPPHLTSEVGKMDFRFLSEPLVSGTQLVETRVRDKRGQWTETSL